MNSRLSYSIIGLLVIILTCNGSFAQNTTFQKYGLKEGLSSTRVYTTIEDDLGFLWIATDVGVDRFNGANFKHYSLSGMEEIRRSRFYRFYLNKDDKNQIWLLANNGSLYRYSRTQDEFILYHQLKDQAGDPLISNNLHIDHRGKFWIGGMSGVYTFDVQTRTSKLLPGLSGEFLNIIQDRQNNIYLASDQGIFVLDENYDLLYNLLDVCPTDAGLKGARIESLFVDEEYNRLWMGTSTLGLCAFKLSTFELIRPSGLENHAGLSIRAIKKYTEESLIVSIGGVGLYILDLKELIPIDRFSFKQDDPNSLSANSIFDIYQNKDGIFFISTFRGGLNSYNPYQLNIQSITQIPGDPNSLENNNILSLEEVSDHVIGFGTAKGVSLWNKTNDSWTHLSEVASKKNILSGFVHAVAVDGDQNLWTSSYTDHITRYDLTGQGRYALSDKIPSGDYSGEIRCIYSDKEDIVYFANLVNGIISYSISKGSTQLFPIGEMSVITPISKTQLALGGPGGLWFLDTESARIEKPEFIQSSILSDQVVNSLCLDSEKQLWVATADAGIFVVNFDKLNIRQISNEDGLPSNFVFSVLEAGSNIWISTNKGISRINKEGSIYTLFEADGLISTDFNKNAAIRSSDGYLYFGTNNGVIYFDPNAIKPVNSIKSLVLTDFYINHQLTSAGKKSPLKQEINATDKVELEYTQNSFALGFSIIDFIHPGVSMVEWTLEGFDDDWISYDKTDLINYTNLSPGSYKLKLRVINEKAEVVTEEKHIQFIVRPPFWGSIGAYIIYAIVVLLIISAIIYFSRLKMESRKAEERLHFLINTAHEIKTPLTLIKAPLQDALNNEASNPSLKQNLSIALKSADKLQNQMIQFLDFRNMRDQERPMLAEHIDMLNFLREKVMAFDVMCKRKNINLTFNTSLSELYIKSDQKIIDVVVSNLVSNAIKYTKENGAVNVRMRLRNRLCEIIVSDTGIGIPKSQQKKVFNLFYRAPEALKSGITGSGVGLVLAVDLAKQIKGKITLVDSSEMGSTFRFSFPCELSEAAADLESNEIEEIPDEVSEGGASMIEMLFVEDDEELRHYARSKLQKEYQVVTASDGKSALEMVNKNMPDIIITDVSMPKMNGRQLCMTLKSNLDTCHIPIILLTGLTSKENVIQGFESGADAYVTKPIDFDLLFQRINTLLENRQILKRKFLQLDDVEDIELANELDRGFIDRITKYVEENISDPELSLNDLYQYSGMSRTAFYHKLKTLIDISPSDFIRSIRFKKAVYLLKMNKHSISEVAYLVGFSDAKYFSTSFKKHFGKSPSAFVGNLRS